MKRKYETVVVFDGSLPDETINKEQEKIEAFLKENAEFGEADIWGKRNLASVIKKKTIGFYIFFVYTGENDMPEKMEKLFKLNQRILRHMTVLFVPKAVISQKELEKKPEEEEGEE